MTSLIFLKVQTLKLTSPELVNLGIWGLWRENRSVLCGGHSSQQTGAWREVVVKHVWLFSPPVPSWWCQLKWDVVSVVDFQDQAAVIYMKAVMRAEEDLVCETERFLQQFWMRYKAHRARCSSVRLLSQRVFEVAAGVSVSITSCTGGVCIRPYTRVEKHVLQYHSKVRMWK